MKIKGFKLQRNKSFTYVPRHKREQSHGSSYTFDSSFTRYREQSSPGDRRNIWRNARTEGRKRNNSEVNRRLLLIFMILVFLVLWIFDFDLSFFQGDK